MKKMQLVFILPLQFLSFALWFNAGCSKEETQSMQFTSDITSKKYLALGDSYTIGQSVDPSFRFPAQTAAILKDSGINISNIQYIATTGWTTYNLQDAIHQQNPQGPFDVVSLLIGVNDQYQRHDTIGYRAQFTNLLQISVRLAGNKKENVFVLSIPDYSVTPFAQGYNTASIRKEIDEFNAINKEVTLSRQITYVDITAISRDAATDAALIAGDGLHPSGKQYAMWANLLAQKMKAVLQ